MGKRLLIALTPQKKVVENLFKIRKIVGINIKKRSGLKTPHITIVDNSFSDIRKVDKELKEIAKSFKPFSAKINGLDTFVVKKAIGIERYKRNNSLIYRIKNNSSLIRLRKELLKRLDYLKTSDRLMHWIKENPKISQKNLVNIKKYGTPFGLREWKFHTTIGLITKKKQKNILKKIKKLNLQESWKIDHFGLFVRKNNGWMLFKKYYFNRETQ